MVTGILGGGTTQGILKFSLLKAHPKAWFGSTPPGCWIHWQVSRFSMGFSHLQMVQSSSWWWMSQHPGAPGVVLRFGNTAVSVIVVVCCCSLVCESLSSLTLPETNSKRPWKLVRKGDDPVSFRGLKAYFEGWDASFRDGVHPWKITCHLKNLSTRIVHRLC